MTMKFQKGQYALSFYTERLQIILIKSLKETNIKIFVSQNLNRAVRDISLFGSNNLGLSDGLSFVSINTAEQHFPF